MAKAALFCFEKFLGIFASSRMNNRLLFEFEMNNLDVDFSGSTLIRLEVKTKLNVLVLV